ncbi:uncharacterized protein [Primulina eburnea]|uniref:uncharacterized protein n=1 Tax=Primulina eburnea TaxID=1245227 RepID=UPI003C6C5FA6
MHQIYKLDSTCDYEFMIENADEAIECGRGGLDKEGSTYDGIFEKILDDNLMHLKAFYPFDNIIEKCLKDRSMFFSPLGQNLGLASFLGSTIQRYRFGCAVSSETRKNILKAGVFDAVSILGEYLVEEPWLKLLCDKLQLNLNDRRNAPAIEIPPTSSGSDLAPFNPIQMNNGVDKRSTRTTRQAKKTKVEKDSHNIKDMFGRATRNGR